MGARRRASRPAEGLSAAAEAANRETSGRAAAIVAEDAAAAREFTERYVGAGVFWNRSTRLLDGYRMFRAPETGINLDRVPGPRGQSPTATCTSARSSSSRQRHSLARGQGQVIRAGLTRGLDLNSLEREPARTRQAHFSRRRGCRPVGADALTLVSGRQRERPGTPACQECRCTTQSKARMPSRVRSIVGYCDNGDSLSPITASLASREGACAIARRRLGQVVWVPWLLRRTWP